MSDENTCLTLWVKLDSGTPLQITFHMCHKASECGIIVHHSRSRDTENNSGEQHILLIRKTKTMTDIYRKKMKKVLSA